VIGIAWLGVKNVQQIRVSQVIDHLAEPYLVSWKLKNKDYEKISAEALTIGSFIDQYVKDDLNGVERLPGAYPINVANCVKAWFKFKEDRPDVVERLVKYRHNMQRELVLGDLVGHPDFILDDEVIDLKTSKRISKSHWMQTAQYAWMWEKINKHPAFTKTYVGFTTMKKISVLRLCKETGTYEYRTLEEPFFTFWQRKFQARYECFKEEVEFTQMMRVKLEDETDVEFT